MASTNTKAAITPVKFAHAVLRTNKINQLRDFYLDFLGATLAFEEPNVMVLIRYDDEHHRIGIIGIPDIADKVKASSGLEHLAFTHASVEELAMAYKARKERHIMPFWSVNHGPTISVYYHDPDGNIVETQADLMSAGEADAFMRSEAYRKNMIGVDFDPDQWLAAVEKGQDMTSSASWTSEQLDPSMVNTVAAASTGPEATASMHQVDLGLMLGNVEEVGLPCPLPQEGSDPIFVEAAMLASVKPTPYISESSTLYLWHVFTDRVEPMTRLVHAPSFTPVVLAAARNGGWMADKAASMLLASILFAAVSVMDQDDGTAPDDLCATTLCAALRAQIDDMLSDSSMDISPSLHSLQAIALLLVVLRAQGEDQSIGPLSRQARAMARSLAPMSTPFMTEMHRRCWWSIVAVQNRCAEECRPLTRDYSWWDDFVYPLNVNDCDLHPTLDQTPQSRRGITDLTLLLVRMEMMRLINTVTEELAGVPSEEAVNRCRDIASQKLQFLQHEYLRHADESRRGDGFLILTCRVLKAKINMMILRHQIVCSEHQPQTDALKDEMDDAAMTVLETSQAQMTDVRYRPWMWLFGSFHQSYVMAYILSRLGEDQAKKHGTRMRAFLAGLCWKSWLDRLDSAEHRDMLTKLHTQAQHLDYVNAGSLYAGDAFGQLDTNSRGPTQQWAATLAQ
ncbi:Biphenyl-2,3-diol 1,2-dioxygenase 3 [Cyphellophora attinorum]|uniref:Biphenyl-2,3-diol 1,2-dioxygenase 3 n=1 Tax=Cyphellophora attinorum TaxID=1664694 RepID=A0A0N1I1K3_9EURO|nr:Biphenyl-2,3-diol 1,2-dioxygenase 3 [Phialophora attinorum]KPI45774.1 Biphenyl-2,3-diol 1,2-dioxygenase 3 [Phialophora attinorum]